MFNFFINKTKSLLILLESSIKFLLAYLSTRAQPKNEDLFLIGSGYGEHIDSNATVLLDYIKSKGMQVYLVSNIAGNSNDHLIRNSFTSFKKYFLSSGVFYSHCLSDVLPNMHRASVLVNLVRKPKLIFIQHGVIGLEKELNNEYSMREYAFWFKQDIWYYDCFVDKEKNIVQKEWPRHGSRR